MNTQDLLSIVAIVVSTVLSAVSIILALIFYKEGNKQNKEIALMQMQIKEAVNSLKNFHKDTYSTTFDVLKNQMNAMQNYIFPVKTYNSGSSTSLKHLILAELFNEQSLSLDQFKERIPQFSAEMINQEIETLKKADVLETKRYLISLKQPNSPYNGVEENTSVD